MSLKILNKPYYIDIDSKLALKKFTDILYSCINKNIEQGYGSVVFVCIGTDRSTGDSLGPLIGYKIGNVKYGEIYVYGTLESPVHAKNIDRIKNEIILRHNKPFIIAIDACLGSLEHVGYISVGEGSIKPGSGINKNLKPIGDMYITGIVNFGGFMDFMVLQNTRLNTVMKMADLISAGIKYVSWKIDTDQLISSIDVKL